MSSKKVKSVIDINQDSTTLSRQLDAMNRLHDISTLFIHKGNWNNILLKIVEAAVSITGADFGNIQVLDQDSSQLNIMAQKGFPKWWLDFWNTVHQGQGVCGTALEKGERIIVEDVEKSPIFIGTPALEIQLRADVHAVQSTPIRSRFGKPLGMFSTHFNKPHRPNEQELQLLDLLAQQAADIIESKESERQKQNLEKEQQLTEELTITNEELQSTTEELQKSNEELRKTENLLSSITNSSSDVIYIKDCQSHWIFVNPALQQLMGRNTDDLLGKTDVEIYSNPEIGKTILENDRRIMTSGKEEILEEDFETQDGIHSFISVKTPRYNQNGQVIGIVGISHDITERKEIEESLHESEERFRDLADNIPNLAWMADADGWIFWYNKQWYEYTGTTLEEMQGWGWQKVHHPDYVDSVTEEWSEKILAEEPYDNIFPLKGKNGNYRWFLTRITPIRDQQGKVQRWFGTNTDVTERKNIEENLEITMNELKQSNKELEQFAYITSHDLRETIKNDNKLFTTVRKNDIKIN